MASEHAQNAQHPHYAWTVAAAASDWNNDSGAGYDDDFDLAVKRETSGLAVCRDTSGLSVASMSMAQVTSPVASMHGVRRCFSAALRILPLL